MLQTKGDANKDADPVWITRDTVRGEVKHVMPGLGYLALMAATLSGKLFLMAVFLWMIAAKVAVSWSSYDLPQPEKAAIFLKEINKQQKGE